MSLKLQRTLLRNSRDLKWEHAASALKECILMSKKVLHVVQQYIIYIYMGKDYSAIAHSSPLLSAPAMVTGE